MDAYCAKGHVFTRAYQTSFLDLGLFLFEKRLIARSGIYVASQRYVGGLFGKMTLKREMMELATNLAVKNCHESTNHPC